MKSESKRSSKYEANWNDPKIRERRAAAMSLGAKARWADSDKRQELLAIRGASIRQTMEHRLTEARETFQRLGFPAETLIGDFPSARLIGGQLYRANSELFSKLAFDLGVCLLAHKYQVNAVGWSLLQNQHPKVFDASKKGARWYWCKCNAINTHDIEV